MITVDQARRKFCAAVSCQQQVEVVPLAKALFRVTAAAITSGIAVPPADNSAMDGFAVDSSDLSVGETNLQVSQRIPAGAAPQALQPGTAARIFTGGVMPAGADAVVIQENCVFDETNQLLKILKGVASGENVRLKGQDIQPGSQLIGIGQRLTAVDLGMLASVGQAKVSVYRPVRVAVFSTGDELVEPGQVLRPGQIYNSNRIMLNAVCEQIGYEVIDCGIVEDSLSATKAALTRAAEQSDLILTSGGVSVGDEDYIRPAIAALGQIEDWKVKMKPGKPVVFGQVADTPILGLPGNPVSSYIVFQLLGVPVLRKLQGQKSADPVVYKLISAFNKAKVSREEYIRVKITQSEDAQPSVEHFKNQSSGVLSSLSWADGLVRQQIGQTIVKGQAVEFLPLRDGIL